LNLDVEIEALGHVDPEVAELAEARGQDLVAGGQGVAVPEEGKMKTCASLVLKTFFRSLKTLVERSGKREERWSSMATIMARCTRSGTLVGPGTKRKLRPVVRGMAILLEPKRAETEGRIMAAGRRGRHRFRAHGRWVSVA
jgi:hypothetical protein